MKTKIFLIATVAVMLLSFTIVTAKKSSARVENGSEKGNKGFVLQDSNQF